MYMYVSINDCVLIALVRIGRKGMCSILVGHIIFSLQVHVCKQRTEWVVSTDVVCWLRNDKIDAGLW